MPDPVSFRPAAACTGDVGQLIRRIALSFAQQADRRLLAHGLTSVQGSALLAIQQLTCPSAVEIARRLDMDSGALTRLLDRLEANGFCVRRRSSRDRRVTHLRLTAKGHEALADVPVVISEVLDRYLAGFSRHEASELQGYLTRILANGSALGAAAEAACPTPRASDPSRRAEAQAPAPG